MAKENYLSTIEQEFPRMSKTQKVIAMYILENPMKAAFSTAKELSVAIDASPASIIRFAQFVTDGKGYPELQAEIQKHVQSITDPMKRLKQNVVVSDEANTIFSTIYETQLGNINKTINQNLISSIVKASELIRNASHIYTTGSRASYASAYFIGMHLNRIFNNTDIIEVNDRIADYLMRTSEKDVVLFVGLPRNSTRLLKAAMFLKEKGTPVITITSTPRSPFVPYSDVALYASCQSNDFHNSQVAVMLVSELIVSYVISKSLGKASESLKTIENTFVEMNQFCE